MDSKITRFSINPRYFPKWLHQNRGEVIDIVEGCLLDDYLVQTKRGYAAVYEHFLNEWSSDYHIEFQAGRADELFERWDEHKRIVESYVLPKEVFS